MSYMHSFGSFIRRSPDPNSYFEQGKSLYKTKNYNEAIRYFKMSLEVDPANDDAWYNIGVSLDDLGKSDEAVLAYSEALKINPRKTNALYNIGIYLFSLGKYKEANATYDEALRINPENSNAWINKGMCLKNMGKHEEAVRAFDEGLNFDPRKAIVWVDKGLCFYQMGKYEEAISSFNEALKVDFKCTNALVSKGISLKALNKNEEAIQCYERALEMDPKHVNAWCNKACSLYFLGKYEAALEANETALKFDPHFKMANENKKLYQKKLEEENSKRAKVQDFISSGDSKIMKSTIIADKLKSRLGGSNISSKPPLKKGDLLDDSYIKNNFKDNEVQLIGRGSFGKVVSALRKDGGEKLAIKVIETKSEDEINDSLNELMNLTVIKDHPNIMAYQKYRLNHVMLNDKNQIFQLFVEMKLADSNLENILSENTRIPEDEILHVLSQIGTGLMYAHERKLAHLDLKPENILIVGDKFMIADWGGSLQLKSSGSTSIKFEFGMTKGYEAPEINHLNYEQKERYNYYHCDIYSLAMILFRMCGVSKETLEDIPKKIRKNHDKMLVEILQELEEFYSKEFLNLLKRMASFDPNERISLREAVDYGSSHI